MTDDKPKRIVRAADAAAASWTYRHPLNPDSEITGAHLAALAGLRRLGVNIARVPPGKESFVYHRHHAEEEWVYVLDGRGQSEIEGEFEEAGPGDFIGYPRGVAHTLRNIGETDLVYLMGGEQLDMEIAEFPKLAKRIVRLGETAEIADESAITRFWPPEE